MRRPVPQLWEQSLQAPQLETRQSSSHGTAPQVRCSTSHAAHSPPLTAALVTERVRDALPLPQVLEQPPHALHAETSHSAGHGKSCAQGIALLDAVGHGTPPPSAARSTESVQVCVPLPQVPEHAPQPS